MSTHTPGSWVARPDQNGTADDFCIGLNDDCSPIDYVAVCHKRDARLIAAAPDLLEAGAALDSAMDMQEKRETGAFHLSMPAARHVWDEARAKWAAAIAKATGDA